MLGETPKLEKCPNCYQTSLFWNEKEKRYECLNYKCKLLQMNTLDNKEARLTEAFAWF